jgi:hypothetical protein
VAEFVLRLVKRQGEVASEGGGIRAFSRYEGDGNLAGTGDRAFGEVGDLMEHAVEVSFAELDPTELREGVGRFHMRGPGHDQCVP